VVRLLVICATVLLALIHGSSAQDLAALCRTKYAAISDGFYAYNEKGAVSNALMDRIALYADPRDVRTIRRRDAQEWYWAIDAVVQTGQPMLQKLLEYRALKCAGDQTSELEKMISKATADLKIARTRQGTLREGFPAGTFNR